jgi:hypothetical protein
MSASKPTELLQSSTKPQLPRNVPRSRHLPTAVTDGSLTENVNKTGVRRGPDAVAVFLQSAAHLGSLGSRYIGGVIGFATVHASAVSDRGLAGLGENGHGSRCGFAAFARVNRRQKGPFVHAEQLTPEVTG